MVVSEYHIQENTMTHKIIEMTESEKKYINEGLSIPTVVIISYIVNSKALMDFYREKNQL